VQAARSGLEERHFRLRRELPALLAVVAAIAAIAFYRRYGVEPRFWAASCIARHPPFGCTLRRATVWLQGQDLWGSAALALGLAAFMARRLSLVLAALVLGGAAVINFNAGLGMFGLALGAWTWLRLPGAAPSGSATATASGRPEEGRQHSTSGPGD